MVGHGGPRAAGFPACALGALPYRCQTYSPTSHRPVHLPRPHTSTMHHPPGGLGPSMDELRRSTDSSEATSSSVACCKARRRSQMW